MTSLDHTGLNKKSHDIFVYWHKLRRDNLLINVLSQIAIPVCRKLAAVLLSANLQSCCKFSMTCLKIHNETATRLFKLQNHHSLILEVTYHASCSVVASNFLQTIGKLEICCDVTLFAIHSKLTISSCQNIYKSVQFSGVII